MDNGLRQALQRKQFPDTARMQERVDLDSALWNRLTPRCRFCGVRPEEIRLANHSSENLFGNIGAILPWNETSQKLG